MKNIILSFIITCTVVGCGSFSTEDKNRILSANEMMNILSEKSFTDNYDMTNIPFNFTIHQNNITYSINNKDFFIKNLILTFKDALKNQKDAISKSYKQYCKKISEDATKEGVNVTIEKETFVDIGDESSFLVVKSENTIQNCILVARISHSLYVIYFNDYSLKNNSQFKQLIIKKSSDLKKHHLN